MVSLISWVLLVYSVRVAGWGNPLYVCLCQASEAERFRVQQVASEGRLPASPGEQRLVQSFSRLVMLELVAFVAEIGLLVWLLGSDRLRWLAIALLAKNLILAGLSWRHARQSRDTGVMDNLVRLPGWLVWLDRGSALVSAAGCLVIFLDANHLMKIDSFLTR
jgi:hypothetical protein